MERNWGPSKPSWSGSLSAVAKGHTQRACPMLTEFKVGEEVGVPWLIRHATACALIADATRIQAVLGCGTGA